MHLKVSFNDYIQVTSMLKKKFVSSCRFCAVEGTLSLYRLVITVSQVKL